MAVHKIIPKSNPGSAPGSLCSAPITRTVAAYHRQWARVKPIVTGSPLSASVLLLLLSGRVGPPCYESVRRFAIDWKRPLEFSRRLISVASTQAGPSEGAKNLSSGRREWPSRWQDQ